MASDEEEVDEDGRTSGIAMLDLFLRIGRMMVVDDDCGLDVVWWLEDDEDEDECCCWFLMLIFTPLPNVSNSFREGGIWR